MEYYTIMKDKIAQRERTESLVGGARTFNEFVKEKALASNITPACVRSLPEIKEEWKQLKLKQLAEKKAEKTATKEAKKAEKKAEQQAKKASAKSTTAVAKEKTAIKKVAKKADENAENIKMVLVEKAHKKSQEEKPPAEPKSKGRPKKYATPEEARRAKIEATKVLNKAKKALKPPKPPKPPKQPKPQKRGKTPPIPEPVVTAELIAREAEEARRKVTAERERREAREREKVEEKDAGEKLHPLVQEIDVKINKAKTIKEIDEVLRLIKQATQPNVYDTLDPENVRVLDHSIDVYSKKKLAWVEHHREAEKNIAMFKTAKENRKISAQEEEKARLQKEAEEKERAYQEEMLKRQMMEDEIKDIHEEILDVLMDKIATAPRGTTKKMIKELDLNRLARGDYSPTDEQYLLAEWAEYHTSYILRTLRPLLREKDAADKKEAERNARSTGMREAMKARIQKEAEAEERAYQEMLSKKDKVGDLHEEILDVLMYRIDSAPVGTSVKMVENLDLNRLARGEYPQSNLLAEWARHHTSKLLRALKQELKEREKKGKGFDADAVREFKNYGKIQDHLGEHLNDLKEAIDPKDLRDYIHFTKEKARLKSKLVGGLVRMIGGELSSSDSESESDSDM